MARALADGLFVKGENGYQLTEGTTEEDLAEYGLSIEKAEKFIDELGDSADELKEFGEGLR